MTILRLTFLFLFAGLAFSPGQCPQGLERRYPRPPQVDLPAGSPTLYDYAGCIHIHSSFSHDSRGTLQEILDGGGKSGCDFLIITDHNNLKFRRFRGVRRGILLIVGAELSTRNGHVLALGVSKLPSSRLSTADRLKDIQKQGGMAVIAHPKKKGSQWTGGDKGFDGMEVYNLGSEYKRANKARFGTVVLTVYPQDRKRAFVIFLRRPDGELALYDRISQTRRLTLVGSVDAHAVPVPGQGKIDMYGHVFPMVRLHCLAAKCTEKEILSALKKGRTYSSLDLLADATGFTYYGRLKSGKTVLMGDQVPYQKGISLHAKAPESARFVLYRNGRLHHRRQGKQYRYRPTQPGVYRLEVEIANPYWGLRTWLPWIYTNPIYIK